MRGELAQLVFQEICMTEVFGQVQDIHGRFSDKDQTFNLCVLSYRIHTSLPAPCLNKGGRPGNSAPRSAALPGLAHGAQSHVTSC